MKITITEYCKKLSLNDKRMELIGGFHAWMKNKKKITKATEAEFKGHFDTFRNMPA